jgi:hypothetical protein
MTEILTENEMKQILENHEKAKSGSNRTKKK